MLGAVVLADASLQTTGGILSKDPHMRSLRGPHVSRALSFEISQGSAKPATYTNSTNGTKYDEHEEQEYVDATVAELDPEGELVMMETEAM